MTAVYSKVDKTISKYVIFSGDPWRVEVLAKMLKAPKHHAFSREFNSYTGDYNGVKVTISSTGIGAPSAAVVMEEMYENGMEVAIRMGTSMALRDDLLGKFIIPAAAIREEGTSLTYAPPGYPAAADIELVNCMNRAVLAAGMEYDNGITCTMDGFYSQMRESRLSKERGIDMQKTYDRLRGLRAVGIDMETSCMLTLARLMGIRGCVVTMVTVLENLKAMLAGAERSQAEELLCRVVLDGIVLLNSN